MERPVIFACERSKTTPIKLFLSKGFFMARYPVNSDWHQSLTPIKTQTFLSDQVYENLTHAILTQQIKPGQHLVEQPLADQLGVSRISVREAIRRLAQDGLVEIVPSKGSFVVNLTAEDVKEIYQLRSALETIALQEIMTQQVQVGKRLMVF